MPELPDVEIAKRRLAHALGGATITAAQSKDRWVLRPHAPSALTKSLVGRKVREVNRRGKWLRVLLEDGGKLFSHLGMTGWWIEREPEYPKERSERARIDVVGDDGKPRSARYMDSRRFGRLIVAKDDIEEWTSLGPDPLDHGIDTRALAAAFARTGRAVKESLMDQSILAGIGNILATEALWYARLDPRSKSDALSRADVAAIVRGLKKEIRRELTARETAKVGYSEDDFAVYGRAGKPCPREGATIVRVIIAGRTTAFCKACQMRRGLKSSSPSTARAGKGRSPTKSAANKRS
jgi:formamidopyrimidine-DNA glycosylase